jgi:hypothetical protein
MGTAPYHHSYKRSPRTAGEAEAQAPRNPAYDVTDQGAEPRPGDLVWCIRHAWRVVYYAYRESAGLPLWDGVDDFEILMTDILLRLTRDFEPIEPIPRSPPVTPQERSKDARDDRVFNESCKVYRHPVFERRERKD